MRKGGIAILPTDTVYGFSAIAHIDNQNNDEQIADTLYATKNTAKKIRTIKGREENKPFIVLISQPADIKKYTHDKIPQSLLALWPGALTVIVNNLNGDTTAFRCPGDEWLRKVIEKSGSPIYSTSVNRSGKPVLSSIAEIKAEFERDVDLIIDDGDKPDALPSTIVKINSDKIQVIRQGSVIVPA